MGILTSDLMTKQIMSNCFRFRALSLILFVNLLDTTSTISEILGMVSGRFPYLDYNKQQKRGLRWGLAGRGIRPFLPVRYGTGSKIVAGFGINDYRNASNKRLGAY